MLPHLPEVDTLKCEPVRQAVFGGGPLCQRHSRRLNVDPGDGQFRLPLQEQQPQQAGAAAQIADPQSGGELRQGGQQKGVRAGAASDVYKRQRPRRRTAARPASGIPNAPRRHLPLNAAIII
mgnify:CR=1 FL=1